MSFKSESDLAFFKERQRHYRGRAKIQLTNLDFGQSQRFCQDINTKNVTRLVQVFTLEGCLRLEPEHRIPASVPEDVLNTALARSGISLQQLLEPNEPPFLDFKDIKIAYLHGRHRAVRRPIILFSGSMAYLSLALTSALTTNIEDEYSNALNFCHGNIFRNLRYAQNRGSKLEEERWLARLNSSTRDDLFHFQKKKDFEQVRNSLDQLLPFPDFWPALKIGCLRRLFCLQQPEELASYLSMVSFIWRRILLHSEDLYALLDYNTVDMLQSRNPCFYSEDLLFIRHAMDRGTLFPQINDPSKRTKIFEELVAMQYYIPTIDTFLEDTKWLEPCAMIVRKHLLPKAKGSTFSQLYRSFRFTDMGYIELEGGKFRAFKASRKTVFTIAYRQLYVYAWRYFPELSCILPKKDKKLPKPQAKAHNEVLSSKFIQFAHTLGFHVPVMEEKSAEVRMIERFLLEIRPLDIFHINLDQANALVGKIHDLIEASYSTAVSNKTTQNFDKLHTVQSRCGRPADSSHRNARMSFYYLEIYGPTDNPFLSNNSNIFGLFFGKDPLTSDCLAVDGTVSSGSAKTSDVSSNRQDPVTQGNSQANNDPTILNQSVSQDDDVQDLDLGDAEEVNNPQAAAFRNYTLIDFDNKQRVAYTSVILKRQIQNVLKDYKFAIMSRMKGKTKEEHELKFINVTQVSRFIKSHKIMYCRSTSAEKMQKEWEEVFKQASARPVRGASA